MAKNEVYRAGQYFPGPVPSPTPAGSPVRLGHLNAVTVTDVGLTINGVVNDGAESGNYHNQASLDTGGAHIVPVVVASAAMAFGDIVYIKSDGTLTNVATSANPWGIYIEPTSTPIIASPGALCVVKVIPFTV